MRESYAFTAAHLTLAAFGAYFCMYAFRKPIAVARFDGATFLGTGVELKTALLVGQVVGYALSKYLGIVVCSALGARARAATLVGFVVLAEFALVLFAVVPDGWKAGAMFLNGLPLGMVWGLVIRYLEGRRSSEVLLSGLSISFIVSSGVVKDVGLWTMDGWGVSEAWMPAVTGSIFILPFVACVALLEAARPPDAQDVAARRERTPMSGVERRAFLRRYALSLAPLLLLYLFLTAYRDFRDNYGIEIFAQLGYADSPALFTRAEAPAGLAVLVAMGLLVLVRDNVRGLLATYGLMGLGLVIVLGTTLAFRAGQVSGMTWMVGVGVGSYLAYVPVGAVFFDRLTAIGGSAGTAVFGIYVADAIGYTGSVGTQLFKDLGAATLSRADFFLDFSVGLSILGLVCLTASAWAVFRAVSREAGQGTVSAITAPERRVAPGVGD